MGTKFNPPTLVQIPSKGNKWFVVVTKPEELQAFSKNKQARLSTGTTDRRRAEALMSKITQEIYEKFQKEIDDIYLRSQARSVDPAAMFTSQITAEPKKVFISDAFTIQQFGLDKDPTLKFSRLIPKYFEYLEGINKDSRKERGTKLSKLKEFVDVVDENNDLHLENVKKKHAYDYAEWMAHQGRANKTIRSNVSRVSAMLGWAERKGYIEQWTCGNPPNI